MTMTDEQKRLHETDIHLDFGRRIIRVKKVLESEGNFCIEVAIGSPKTDSTVAVEHVELLSLSSARKLCDRLHQVIRS